MANPPTEPEFAPSGAIAVGRGAEAGAIKVELPSEMEPVTPPKSPATSRAPSDQSLGSSYKKERAASKKSGSILPSDYYTDGVGIFKEDYVPHGRSHSFLHHVGMAVSFGAAASVMLIVFGFFPIAGYEGATPLTHAVNRCWFGVFAVFTGFIVLGNAQPTGFDKASLYWLPLFPLPYALITAVVPIVNGSAEAGADDEALNLNVAGFSRVLAVPLFCLPAWVWARRQMGRDWMKLHRMCSDPDKRVLFRRAVRNLIALIFSLFPIYYLQYDISLITSGKRIPADSPVLLFRPVISLIVKKLSWVMLGHLMTNLAEDTDKEEQKHAAVHAVHACFFALGMHTAFKVAQSRTLGQVISYGLVDGCVVVWKLWVFYGVKKEPTWRDPPNALRSIYLLPNPEPPHKTSLQAWTGYQIVAEGLGFLAALFCLLFLYPLASLLEDDVIVKCFFPVGVDSFYRLLGLTVLFCFMEAEVGFRIMRKLECNFTVAFKRPYVVFRSVMATSFAPALLVNYAFLFKQTKVGPWLEQ